jgi:hypothetical protein
LLVVIIVPVIVVVAVIVAVVVLVAISVRIAISVCIDISIRVGIGIVNSCAPGHFNLAGRKRAVAVPESMHFDDCAYGQLALHLRDVANEHRLTGHDDETIANLGDRTGEFAFVAGCSSIVIGVGIGVSAVVVVVVPVAVAIIIGIAVIIGISRPTV